MTIDELLCNQRLAPSPARSACRCLRSGSASPIRRVTDADKHNSSTTTIAPNAASTTTATSIQWCGRRVANAIAETACEIPNHCVALTTRLLALMGVDDALADSGRVLIVVKPRLGRNKCEQTSAALISAFAVDDHDPRSAVRDRSDEMRVDFGVLHLSGCCAARSLTPVSFRPRPRYVSSRRNGSGITTN
jgi:hypothetical protein